MTLTTQRAETVFYPQPLPTSEVRNGQVSNPDTARAMAYAEKPFRDQIADGEWNAQAVVADMMNEPEVAKKYTQKIQRNLAIAAVKAEKARKDHLGIPR